MKSLFLLVTVLCATAASALEWKSQQVSIKAAPLQRTTETTFEFTNTSDRPVTITGIDTSCDCTEATPSARTFPPGAQGTIKAHFNLTGAVGTLQRMIVINTDEGTPATSLTVELTIPEIARLTPRSVEWALGAASREAVVEIEIATDIELTIDRVTPTSDTFTYRLETVKPGRHFRLHLAPKDVTKPASAAFRLFVKTATGEELVFSAYANVR